MGDIDSSDFDVICTTAELGRSVTRTVNTDTIDSTWGSVTTYSQSTSSVIAIIVPVNDKDIVELQGRVKKGDCRGYFTQGTTMNNDDLITDGSTDYRVENLRVMNAGSNSIFQKCVLIRL